MNTNVDKRASYLLNLIDSLYSANDIYTRSKVLFSKLEKLIPFRSASLWLIDSETWNIGEVIDYRRHSKNIEKCQNNFIQNGFLSQDSQWPVKFNRSFIYSATGAMLKENEVHCECERHTLSAIAGINEQPISVVNLYRSEVENSFTTENGELFNQIVAHLAKAIALDPSMNVADPNFAPGIMVYSADRELLFRNQRSLEILPEYSAEKILELAQQANIKPDDSMCCYLRAYTPQPQSLLYWLNSQSLTALNGHKVKESRHNTVVIAQPFILRHTIEKRLHQSRLSPREFDVALNAIQGLSNAEIAARLYIDETTVKDHLHRIYNKMSVRSRTALVSRVLNLDKELAGLVRQRREFYVSGSAS
jgi:DNA-binding CsgD family transcriptional regulator